MTYPTSPTNGQKFTRADGTVMTFSSASQSWTKDPPTGVPPTETFVDTIGTTSVTIPAKAKKARVKACAGGASGAPAITGTNPENNIGTAGGGGGGSGCGVEFLIDLTGVSAISANIGAGGTSSTSSGAAGGNTILTFTGKGAITLGGGATVPRAVTPTGGGTSPGPGHSGDVGGLGGTITANTLTGVNVLMSSESGNGGGNDINYNAFWPSGKGGSGRYGRGGNSVVRTSDGVTAGLAAVGYGAGGSGACARSDGGSQSPAAGGSGAKGFAHFEWIF